MKKLFIALLLSIGILLPIRAAHALPQYGSFTLNSTLYYQSVGGIPYCMGGTFNAYDTFFLGYITYFYTFEVNGVVETSGSGYNWGWVNFTTTCYYARHGDFGAMAVTATDYYFTPPVTDSTLSDGFMP